MLAPDAVSPEALPVVLLGAAILWAIVAAKGWWRA